MPGGDHCALRGCDNDRRANRIENQKILPHIGILRFYSPENKNDVCRGLELLFKVTINKDIGDIGD